MKPDFEKMALDLADDDPDGTIDITQAGMIAQLREMYAAGYRDGQVRIRRLMTGYDTTEEAWHKITIEEPPT